MNQTIGMAGSKLGVGGSVGCADKSVLPHIVLSPACPWELLAVTELYFRVEARDDDRAWLRNSLRVSLRVTVHVWNRCGQHTFAILCIFGVPVPSCHTSQQPVDILLWSTILGGCTLTSATAVGETPLRVAVIGQGLFGSETYKRLRDDGHNIVGVFTICDDKNGRADVLAQTAEADGIQVRKVPRWKALKK